MMTQEEYMDLLAMRRQGRSIAEIARELGYHPSTISEWINKGGPPPKREIAPAATVIDEKTAARIGELLAAAPKLLSTSIHEVLVAEGFTGSYPSVVRNVRDGRGPRFRTATSDGGSSCVSSSRSAHNATLIDRLDRLGAIRIRRCGCLIASRCAAQYVDQIVSYAEITVTKKWRNPPMAGPQQGESLKTLRHFDILGRPKWLSPVLAVLGADKGRRVL